MFAYLAILLPVVASGVIVEAMSLSDRAIGATAIKAPPIQLPEKLIVGYANWNECINPICTQSYLSYSQLLCCCIATLRQATKRLWMQ